MQSHLTKGTEIRLEVVWPDAEILSSPKVYKNFPKRNFSSLYIKMYVFKTAQRANIHLGYFFKEMCHQER